MKIMKKTALARLCQDRTPQHLRPASWGALRQSDRTEDST